MPGRSLVRFLFPLGFKLLSAVAAVSLSAAAGATAYELSRVATELTHVSQQLARDLRGAYGTTSVRFSANRLSQEAEQLVEAISRGRNPSHVRQQVDDVRRRYLELEEAVLRLDSAAQTEVLGQRMNRLSALYESMNAEFFYSAEQYPPAHQAVPQPLLILPQNRLLPLQPSYRVPGQHYPDYERGQVSREYNRFDYGRIDASRYPAYPHRSPVLERQSRQRQLLNPGAAQAADQGWRPGSGYQPGRDIHD